MKKIIIVFFILALLSLNFTWADENEYIPLISDESSFGGTHTALIVAPADSDNTATVEQTDSAQENALQENTTTQNNNLEMENNTQPISNSQSVNNTQPISNTQSVNNTQTIGNTQSTNNTSNDVAVATPMQNTANPLIAMLLACVLIPIGIYRKRK